MQSRKLGAIAAVVGVVAAIVLFVVLSGGDDSTDDSTTSTPAASTTGSDATAKPEVATIEVVDGKPVGGVADLSFDQGDDIRFVVESDVADEVHLHGYDVMQDVEAGGRVEFDLPATIPGVFEVELEQRVVPLAEITVNPS